jgi:tRNA 2-thiouridine synthesizing protein A
MAENMADQDLDLLGLKCPLPVMRTRKALRALMPGQTLKVLTNDPISAIDIPNLIREEGDVLETQQAVDGQFQFVIRKL